MPESTDASLARIVGDGLAVSPRLDAERIETFDHQLAATGLFTDDALTELLDGYPESDLHVTTMGPTFAAGGWRTGRAEGLSGAELLRAVRTGHLWLNVKRIHQVPAYAELTRRLYAELATASGESPPSWTATTLLISSPRASVHYHLDPVPNILWHVRGRKRVRVYPAGDERFAARDAVERICAGSQDEGLRWSEDLDRSAEVFDLEPGRGILWPQHSPHRVDNLEGLNVSLSTEHMTSRSRRLVRVLRGNWMLRRTGLRPAHARTHGLAAGAKSGLALAHRVMTKLRGRRVEHFEIPATFYVDPTRPQGYRDA